MCHPHHRQTEISTIGGIAEASAWLFAATHRGFDFGAMAATVAPAIPSLRLLVSLGECAAATKTFAQLLEEGREDDPEIDRHAPAPDSPAVFQLSGGTTGIPKLIPRTHDDYLYNALAFAKAADFDRDTVLLVGIPAGHNFALACPGLQGALLAGGRVVFAPSPSGDVILPLIERERVTWIPSVPATLLQWTQHPRRSEFDVSSLRGICVGGQRLNPEPARGAALGFGPLIPQS
jgi:2,3-dihydroxybenzoate-AMP ligase